MNFLLHLAQTSLSLSSIPRPPIWQQFAWVEALNIFDFALPLLHLSLLLSPSLCSRIFFICVARTHNHSAPPLPLLCSRRHCLSTLPTKMQMQTAYELVKRKQAFVFCNICPKTTLSRTHKHAHAHMLPPLTHIHTYTEVSPSHLKPPGFNPLLHGKKKKQEVKHVKS